MSDVPSSATVQTGSGLTTKLLEHLDAILVGVFTITAATLSSLLGYFFALEDRRTLLVLEYDKIRAEHTLELAKTLANAEAQLRSMLIVGETSSAAYCDLSRNATHLENDILQHAPSFSVPQELSLPQRLMYIQFSFRDAKGSLSRLPSEPAVSLASRLDAMLDQHRAMNEKTLNGWKQDEEVRRSLVVDAAATLRVYYRERYREFDKISLNYDKAGLAIRQLSARFGDCDLAPAWRRVSESVSQWNVSSSMFSESLGIALKRN
jgi:hypothetical protein